MPTAKQTLFNWYLLKKVSYIINFTAVSVQISEEAKILDKWKSCF